MTTATTDSDAAHSDGTGADGGFSLRGQFLLAMPQLLGSYFGNSLTLLCEHNADGALGITINKPSRVTLAELLRELDQPIPDHLNADDILIYEGGPVSQERGFVLHRHAHAASLRVAPDLYLSGATDTLTEILADARPDEFLVALGYAGWGSGQLDDEVGANSWLTCPASAEVVFAVEPAGRLQAAANSLGVDYRLLAAAGHA